MDFSNLKINGEGLVVVENKLVATKETVEYQINKEGTTNFWKYKINDWKSKGYIE